jgi:hypothetical protein
MIYICLGGITATLPTAMRLVRSGEDSTYGE